MKQLTARIAARYPHSEEFCRLFALLGREYVDATLYCLLTAEGKQSVRALAKAIEQTSKSTVARRLSALQKTGLVSEAGCIATEKLTNSVIQHHTFPDIELFWLLLEVFGYDLPATAAVHYFIRNDGEFCSPIQSYELVGRKNSICSSTISNIHKRLASQGLVSSRGGNWSLNLEKLRALCTDFISQWEAQGSPEAPWVPGIQILINQNKLLSEDTGGSHA